MERQATQRQYRSSDPLKVRMRTHEHYSERPDDLDALCLAQLALRGDEAILDVGCGPGRFLAYLRAHGHAGPLAGCDQSPGMAAEARAATLAARPPVAVIRGEANHLPLRAGSADWVVARHMLYHVPDIPGALREFARVVGPGGRVLAVTNIDSAMPHLDALRDDLLRAFGLPRPASALGARFLLMNGRALLEAAYPEVETTIVENALIFRDPRPIADYLATLFPSLPLPPDSDLPERMDDWLLAEAGRRLQRMGGLWRDPKGVALFRCRVA